MASLPVLNISALSTPQKIALMEELWEDLSLKSGEISPPDWHFEILKEREERLKRGEEEIVDWEVAKRELRDGKT